MLMLARIIIPIATFTFPLQSHFTRHFWHGSFEDGWTKTPIDYIPMSKTCFPEDPLGPDELISPAPRLWPATDTIEFHYPHPVTGKPIVVDNSRAREGFRD